MKRKDGVYRWHLIRIAALKNTVNEVVRWFGTATDIEDQKRIEADLKKIQERLQLAMDAAFLATWD